MINKACLNNPRVAAGYFFFKKYHVNEMGIRRMEYSIVEIQLITIVEALNLICVKLLTKY